MRIVSLIGLKKSGKTTCMEALVREFKERGMGVVAVKSMIHADFSFDEKGKDTWRFKEAGADVVFSLSEEELVYIERKQNTSSLEDFLERVPEDMDIIICEGLRDNSPSIIKILVAESVENVSKTIALRGVEGDILALTGAMASKMKNHDEYPVFDCTNELDLSRLADLIMEDY